MAQDEEIKAYVERDWDLVEREKADSWRRRDLPPSEIMRIAEGLRRQALALCPGWPTAADRQADLATHARVHEALTHVHNPAQR